MMSPQEPSPGNATVLSVWFYLVLALLALGAIWIVFSITDGWMGVGDDSVVYLAAGQNFLEGRGLSWVSGVDIIKPLTHFPPLYPLLLATGEAVFSDALSFARITNALSFAGLVVLAGFAGVKVAGSMFYGVLAALLMLASPILLREMVWVMSEPIYLLLSLAALLGLARYVRSGRLLTLTAAAALLGLALLSRYIGWSLLPAALLAVWLDCRRINRQAFLKVLLVVAVMALPTLIWMLRGFLLTQSTTNRVLAWHPISQSQLKRFAGGFWRWLFSSEFDAWSLYLVAGFSVLLSGMILFILIRRIRAESDKLKILQTIEPLTLLVLVYSISYLVFLLVSISVFDASTPINQRILLPLHVNFLLLLFGITPYLEARFSNTSQARYLPAIALVALLVSYGVRSIEVFEDLRANQSGYIATSWYKSDILAGLNLVPSEAALYTNDPQALYFLSGRTSLSVPLAVDTVIQEERDDYDELLAAMRQEIHNHCGALVLFNSLGLQTQFGAEEILAEGLEIEFFDPSVRIYRASAGSCNGADG